MIASIQYYSFSLGIRDVLAKKNSVEQNIKSFHASVLLFCLRHKAMTMLSRTKSDAWGETVAEKVGLIGLGLMGGVFATRLQDAGFAVLGYDIDAAKRSAFVQRGGSAAASVGEIGRQCSSVLLSVFSIDQVEAVVEGAGGLAGGRSDSIALCASTCPPDRIAALAERSAARGLTLLDAPVSGTTAQVRSGDGLGLIGGDADAAERVSAVLDAIYPKRFHIGRAGDASKAKLAINLILGINRLGLAEGLVFAERLGLDLGAFLKVARASAAYSQVMDVKGDKMVEGDYTPLSKVSQHLKDVRIMLDEATARGQALPLGAVLADILEACMRHGDGERDNAITIEEIRRRSSG
jgi:3-hydroxyisobutyrate dehydrogenase-like beta-hydroxyacid dehydrogenase